MRLLFFMGCLYIHAVLCASSLSVSVDAEAAVLINADTGEVLYAKNAHAPRIPASTTKIGTALFALQTHSHELDMLMTADQDSIGSISKEAQKRSNYTKPAFWNVPDGTHIGIKRGETLSFRDLLFGMILASGNDAANVIAQNIGGTIPKFTDALNDYLKKIGCKNTHFCNPHGVHHPKHLTTAYDLAIMMKEGLKIPLFREVIKTLRYTRPKTDKQDSRILLHTFKLIRKGKHFYSFSIGGKTGYLAICGHNIVAAAKKDNRTLVAVLMGYKDFNKRYSDTIKLFEAGFNQVKVQRVILKKGPQEQKLDVPGASTAVKSYLSNDITIDYYPAENPKVKCMLHWTAKELPIKKDDKIGEIRIQAADGSILKVAPLLAVEDATPSLSWRLRHLFCAF